MGEQFDRMCCSKRNQSSILGIWRWIKKIGKWLTISLLLILLLAGLVILGVIVRHKFWYRGTLSANAPIQRVVLIVVDGLRPDEINVTDTPNIYSLAHRGSYTLKGLSDNPPQTSVAHMSFFTGLTSKTHGVDQSFRWKQIAWAGFWRASIFDYAHALGYVTQVVFGLEKVKLSENQSKSLSLLRFAPFKGIDHITLTDDAPWPKSELALNILRKNQPTFLFLHFLENDTVGHNYGWMTEEQKMALGEIDEAIGNLYRKLKKEGLLQKTLIILLGDHGGNGKNHWDNTDIICKRIPIMFVNPVVKRDYQFQDKAMIYDVTATILKILGDPTDRHLEGQPILNIYK